jgi:hypothetical protein
MEKKCLFLDFLKLLGHWVLAYTLIFYFIYKKKKLVDIGCPPIKMCLLGVYYSKFGCFDS